MVELEGSHQLVSDVECSRSAQRCIACGELGARSEPQIGARTTRSFIGSDSAQKLLDLIICCSQEVLGHDIWDDQIPRSAELSKVAVTESAHCTMFSRREYAADPNWVPRKGHWYDRVYSLPSAFDPWGTEYSPYRQVDQPAQFSP